MGWIPYISHHIISYVTESQAIFKPKCVLLNLVPDVHAAARALAQLGLGEAQNLGELVLATRQRVGHRADVETGLERRDLLTASKTGFG